MSATGGEQHDEEWGAEGWNHERLDNTAAGYAFGGQHVGEAEGDVDWSIGVALDVVQAVLSNQIPAKIPGKQSASEWICLREESIDRLEWDAHAASIGRVNAKEQGPYGYAHTPSLRLAGFSRFD